ncbi:DHHA1 domain-containing protein [Streptomyces sp. NPDC087538]|uniref:DHHA1 domain-containing protein n=1 Tax=Streptomyces sp. NPDC087538 TaxID=3365797 RepID=UPI0037F2926A
MPAADLRARRFGHVLLPATRLDTDHPSRSRGQRPRGIPRPPAPGTRTAGLLDRLKAADRKNARLKQQATTARATGLAGLASDANGFQAVTATTDGGADEARALATAVRDRLSVGTPGAVGVGTHAVVIVVALNKAGRETGLNAASPVKQFLAGRGGSPEPAQGGGLPADRLADALAELPRLIRER